jgi:hypothetical protein
MAVPSRGLFFVGAGFGAGAYVLASGVEAALPGNVLSSDESADAVMGILLFAVFTVAGAVVGGWGAVRRWLEDHGPWSTNLFRCLGCMAGGAVLGGIIQWRRPGE